MSDMFAFAFGGFLAGGSVSKEVQGQVLVQKKTRKYPEIRLIC